MHRAHNDTSSLESSTLCAILTASIVTVIATVFKFEFGIRNAVGVTDTGETGAAVA